MKKEILDRSTVSFRMTVLFVTLFSIALVTALLLVYAALSRTSQVIMDDTLRLEADEFEVLYTINGIEGLKDMLIAESVAEGTENAFYILLSPEMEVLVSTDMTAFAYITEDGRISPEFAEGLLPGEERFFTLYNEPHREYVRLYIKKYDDGTVMEIGENMWAEQLLLKKTRNIFFISSLSILFIGTVVFWNIIRRTMKGVTNITTTVSNIGRNDLVSRVPQSHRGAEIDDLAEAFNRMLERIAVLIGEMQDITNNVAHYLRTPIARIRGTAESVYFTDDATGQSKESLAAIIQECDRLTMMIQVMLEIASVESATNGISEAHIDVHAMLEEIVDLFQPVAETGKIFLDHESTESGLLIRGNPALISGAVANLVDNAVKYTPAGGTVRIGSRRVDGIAEISVSDTGVGISREDRPHVFEKFYRGDRVGSTVGNGLGLSYVQAVARKYRGTVRIDDPEKAGTTFTLVFPVVTEHGEQ